MFPRKTIDDAIKISVGDPKFGAQFFSFSISMPIITSNPENFFCSHFCSSRLFAFWMPSFIHRIMDIIGLSSKKKMIRPNAGATVAFMKDAHSFWNFTSKMLPYKSMSKKMFSFNIKSSISNSIFTAFPNPTARIYIFIDEFFETLIWSLHGGIIACQM